MESRQVKALLQIYHTWFISLYDFHFVINVLGNDWTSQKRWPTQKEHTVSWRHLIIKKFKQILYGRFSTLTFGLKDWFKVTPNLYPLALWVQVKLNWNNGIENNRKYAKQINPTDRYWMQSGFLMKIQKYIQQCLFLVS